MTTGESPEERPEIYSLLDDVLLEVLFNHKHTITGRRHIGLRLHVPGARFDGSPRIFKELIRRLKAAIDEQEKNT